MLINQLRVWRGRGTPSLIRSNSCESSLGDKVRLSSESLESRVQTPSVYGAIQISRASL